MDPEVENYSYYIRKQIDAIVSILDGLSQEEMNRSPSVADANSASVIAMHALGNARAWVLGIACGLKVGPDRPAEFASHGSLADLGAHANEVSREIEAGLAALDPPRLGVRFKPSQELWGAGEVREVTVRSALADVLEHASMHLGQVQLTCDLVVEGRTS